MNNKNEYTYKPDMSGRLSWVDAFVNKEVREEVERTINNSILKLKFLKNVDEYTHVVDIALQGYLMTRELKALPRFEIYETEGNYHFRPN